MSSAAFERPITEIMTRRVVSARPRQSVAGLAELMIENHISCVPIVDDRNHPRGIVTKSDLIELMDAHHEIDDGSLVARTADEVMMPIAITLDEHATVAHAASMMAIEGFHHVMVVSDSGALVGLVSSYDIVRFLAETPDDQSDDQSLDRE